MYGRAHQKRGGEHAPKATPPRGRSLRCGAANARRRSTRRRGSRTTGGRYWEGDARKQQRQWVYGRSTARRASTARWRACAESNTSTARAWNCSPGLRVPALSARQAGFPGLSDARRRDPSCQRVSHLPVCRLSRCLLTPLVPYRSSAVGLELYSGNTFRTLCSL